MKRVLLSCVAAFGIALSPLAAEAGGLRGSIKDSRSARTDGWTGYYFGGQIGGTWADIDTESVAGDAHYYIPGVSVSTSPEGFTGGVHGGVNYQTGNLLLGIDLAYSVAGVDDTTTQAGPFAATNYTTEVNDVFTLSGRIGFATQSWMIYAKGGYANAKISTEQDETPAFAHVGISDERHDGWNAGGGIEFKLTRSLILGFDYTHVDVDAEIHTINDSDPEGPAPEQINVDPDGINMFAVRLTAKF